MAWTSADFPPFLPPDKREFRAAMSRKKGWDSAGIPPQTTAAMGDDVIQK